MIKVTPIPENNHDAHKITFDLSKENDIRTKTKYRL